MSRNIVPFDYSKELHEAIINDAGIRAMNKAMCDIIISQPLPPMALSLDGTVSVVETKNPLIEKLNAEILHRMQVIASAFKNKYNPE